MLRDKHFREQLQHSLSAYLTVLDPSELRGSKVH